MPVERAANGGPMKQIDSTRTRAMPMLAALLSLLAGCDWLEPEPAPGEWSLWSGRTGEYQPFHKAGLSDSNGPGRLLMECDVGAIDLWVATGRNWVRGSFDGVPVSYQLDGNAPTAIMVGSDRARLWFQEPMAATGEHAMVGRIEGARELTVRIDWSEGDRQTLRFDVSRAGAAIARLRRECAESGRQMAAAT
jgi:hypothetical protein